MPLRNRGRADECISCALGRTAKNDLADRDDKRAERDILKFEHGASENQEFCFFKVFIVSKTTVQLI